MGTSNFYKVNIDNYHVLNGDYDEILINTQDNIISELQNELKKKVFDIYSNWEDNKTSEYSLNSFNRINFYHVCLYYKEIEIIISININYGYYENACFDYDIYIDNEYYTIEEIQDLNMSSDEFKAYDSVKFQRVLKQIEKSIKNYTIEYSRIGSFSNGETFYSEVKI